MNIEPASSGNDLSESETNLRADKEREYLLGSKLIFLIHPCQEDIQRMIVNNNIFFTFLERMKYMINIDDIYDNFEDFFRKFDDGIIQCCQYIHPKKEGMVNKIVGNILRAIAGIITCNLIY